MWRPRQLLRHNCSVSLEADLSFAAFLSSEIALFAEKGLGTFHRTADLCERSPVLSNQRDKVVLSVYCFSYIRSEIGKRNATPSTFGRYVIADSIVHCEDVCGYSSSVISHQRSQHQSSVLFYPGFNQNKLVITRSTPVASSHSPLPVFIAAK